MSCCLGSRHGEPSWAQSFRDLAGWEHRTLVRISWTLSPQLGCRSPGRFLGCRPPSLPPGPGGALGVLGEKMECQGEVSAESWRIHVVSQGTSQGLSGSSSAHVQCVAHFGAGSTAPASPSSFIRLCRPSVFLKQRPVVQSISTSDRALSVPRSGLSSGCPDCKRKQLSGGFGWRLSAPQT